MMLPTAAAMTTRRSSLGAMLGAGIGLPTLRVRSGFTASRPLWPSLYRLRPAAGNLLREAPLDSFLMGPGSVLMGPCPGSASEFRVSPASCGGVRTAKGRSLELAVRTREVGMADVLFLGLTLGFFALSWAFIALCDRL